MTQRKQKIEKRPIQFSRYNYQPEIKPDISEQVSQTIPNETYSIRELIQRFGMGIQDKGGVSTINDEEATHDSLDYEKVSRSDITTKHALMEQNQERINGLKAKITPPKDISQNVEAVIPTTQQTASNTPQNAE